MLRRLLPNPRRKRGAEGEATAHSALVLPAAGSAKPGAKFPGNLVAWEATSRSGRATYFFRLVPPEQAAQLQDASKSAALIETAIRQLNRAIVLLNFRREPIYLPDDSLLLQPRFRRYAIACRKLPELVRLRSSFLGRAIHTTPAAWQKQFEGFRRKGKRATPHFPAAPLFIFANSEFPRVTPGTLPTRGFSNELVQITAKPLTHDLRLCRLLCGKAPPFRGGKTPTNPFRAAWKAEPSRRLEREKMGSWAGKAEPFRTAGRQSRIECDSFPLIWTALVLANALPHPGSWHRIKLANPKTSEGRIFAWPLARSSHKPWEAFGALCTFLASQSTRRISVAVV